MTDTTIRRGRGRPRKDAVEAASTSDGQPRPNSEDTTETTQTVASGQLRAFIARVERLEEEKKAIADDIKAIFYKMKGTGFDIKVVRAIVRLRKQDQADRQEFEMILDLYKAALGMA